MNWIVPISADALPAWAAWRDKAPTAAFGMTSPMLPIDSMTGTTIPAGPPTPAKDSATKVSPAAMNIASAARSTRAAPKRRIRCGLSCEDRMNIAALQPNSMPYCAGEKPKCWMNTGEEPPI